VTTLRPRVPLLASAIAAAALLSACGVSSPPESTGSTTAAAVGAGRQTGDTGGIRLSGTIEAIHSRSVIVPRLAGQISPTLVITHLVKSGTMVKPGDLVLELDPQDQVRNTMDRRAEVIDLDDQIQKKRSDQAVASAADETAMAVAEHDLERARLESLKNDLLSRVAAEKNQLAFEQAKAKLDQLKSSVALKQKAADADVKILQIRRERSVRALTYAEENVKLMAVRTTFAGMVVVKTTYKGETQAEILLGDEVRPGLPVMDIIDPQTMQVRARVNQADIGLVAPGQTATIRLDAYPDLSFVGQVDRVAPLGIVSSMTAAVRNFTVLVPIKGTHPRLMPDLTASVDLGPLPDGKAPAQPQALLTAPGQNPRPGPAKASAMAAATRPGGRP